MKSRPATGWEPLSPLSWSMFCFHFVAGICLSRNLLYWSFASRAMFIGSAFGPAFFASELRNARPFWCPLFVWLVFQQYSDPTCPVECIISDVVFRVFLQYARLLSRQLACSQLEMAQAFASASSMSDHFCPSSVVYLLCGWCDVTRKHDEPRLTTYQGKKRS